MDLSLFHLRTFRVGTMVGGLCRIGVNSVPYLLPLMLQVGFGMTAVKSGSLTFVMTIGALMMRPISSHALRMLGFKRVLFWSAVLGAATVGGFALMDPGTPFWLIAVYIALFGFARSFQFMSSNTLAYSDMPAERLSRATSLGGVLQQLTVSLGVSFSAMLLGILTWNGGVLNTARFHEAFLIMAVLPLLSLPGFLTLRPEDGREVSGHRLGEEKV